MLSRLNVSSMKMKIFEFTYFTADAIVSSFLYLISVRQFYDITEIGNARRNNCKLAVEINECVKAELLRTIEATRYTIYLSFLPSVFS